MLERTMDRSSRGDNYFVQRSKYHKGTFKVKEKGEDDQMGTDDDIQIADYSQRPEYPGSAGDVVFDNLRMTSIDKSLADKERSLADPRFRYRHEKDQSDVNRIRFFKQLK